MLKVILYLGLGVWGLRSLFASARPGRDLNPVQSGVYWAALRWENDPRKLLSLAAAFDQEGFGPQASALRKRAALEQLPPAVNAQRQDALRKALMSTDSTSVNTLAAAFESEGLGDSAQMLRSWAVGLDAGRDIQYVPAPRVERPGDVPQPPPGAPETSGMPPAAPPYEEQDRNFDLLRQQEQEGQES